MNRAQSIANEAYPDGLVGSYADDPDGDYGDTLAQFLAAELEECKTIEEAYNRVAVSQTELYGVMCALLDAERSEP